LKAVRASSQGREEITGELMLEGRRGTENEGRDHLDRTGKKSMPLVIEHEYTATVSTTY